MTVPRCPTMRGLGVPWEQWVRFALVVALVGTIIGVVANLVAFVRALRDPEDVAGR